jgi:hypothetical protein
MLTIAKGFVTENRSPDPNPRLPSIPEHKMPAWLSTVQNAINAMMHSGGMNGTAMQHYAVQRLDGYAGRFEDKDLTALRDDDGSAAFFQIPVKRGSEEKAQIAAWQSEDGQLRQFWIFSSDGNYGLKFGYINTAGTDPTRMIGNLKFFGYEESDLGQPVAQ